MPTIKGDLIFDKWESKQGFKHPKPRKMDYCPHCHKRTEHVKYSGYKLCKTCWYQERS